MTTRITIIESAEASPRYRDNATGKEMSLRTFIKRVELGEYPEFDIRLVNGEKTPVERTRNYAGSLPCTS